MSDRSLRTPSYRLHKPTGQAVVTLSGRDHYLGPHGTTESRAEYDRLLAEWLAAGRRSTLPAGPGGSDITVNEFLDVYLDHCDLYYVKGGVPTSEPRNIRLAVRPLRRLHGHVLARDIGPLVLKAVRQAMIDSGLCRTEINKRVRRIVRAFKWAVSEEIVPPSVHQALKAVQGLRPGRADVREAAPVRPVPDALVDPIRPFVSRQVWAMIELQRLTGMRPGEVVIMRTQDIDTSGRVWCYIPATHKTAHHGKERRIYLGPAARAILQDWLRTELSAYLFQPCEAAREIRAGWRANRKSHVPPSQRHRRVRRPSIAPGDRYTTDSYRRAIARATDQAFPHPTLATVPADKLTKEQRQELRVWQTDHRWHPHQIRHSAGRRLRREFGLDVCRAVLGHSSPVVTEVYAELDRTKAAEAMEKVG
jgi:integrase